MRFTNILKLNQPNKTAGKKATQPTQAVHDIRYDKLARCGELFSVVSRLGLAVRRSAVSGRTQVRLPPLRLTFLLKKSMIYGHRLVTLPCTINETKWLDSQCYRCPCGYHPGGDSAATYKLPLTSPSPHYCRYHFCEPDVKLDEGQGIVLTCSAPAVQSRGWQRPPASCPGR